MNKHVPHAFVNQLLVYALVLIGFGGSMGMGAVWLRHQMSVTAEANRRLESRTRGLAAWRRHLRDRRGLHGGLGRLQLG